MSKANLVPEWDVFFDTLGKVFANSIKSNFHVITSLLQNIGYAVAYNLRINVGKLLFPFIFSRLKTSLEEAAKGHKVVCYYPRFLTIIFERIVSPEHQLIYRDINFEHSPSTSKPYYTKLHTSQRFNHVPIVVTPFMHQYIQTPGLIILDQAVVEPPLDQAELPVDPVVPPAELNEPLVDQPTQAEESGGQQVNDQVIPPLSPPTITDPVHGSESQVDPSLVDVRTDHEAVEPQSLTQITEPIAIHSTSQPKSRSKLPVKRRVVDVGTVSVSEPTALSHTFVRKKRKIISETTVSPSLSSQKDMDFEMATKQLLDSPSQQVESIEIRQRALASCEESSTHSEPLSFESEVEPFMLDIGFLDTEREGEHSSLVTVPAIVTAEESLPTSEGKFGLMPNLLRSLSPLPGPFPLAPLRDFPLAVSTGESGRQLSISTTDASQISHSKELVVYTGDRQLRTAIAPPVTSLEGAMVIYTAGTKEAALKELDMRDTQSENLSETQARKESDTLSERQVSAHTDTNTSSLLDVIAALTEQLKKTQGERTFQSTSG